MKDPSEESRYAVMASELESVRDQRNITFELCAWGFGNVETFGGQMGHLWRTSQDITDTWHGVLWNIDVNDEVNRLEINIRFDIIFAKSFYQAICTLDFVYLEKILTGAVQARWGPGTRIRLELPRWPLRRQGHPYHS